ncbi:MAG TPA: glycosyltransferase [Acidimicrobiales bacterium]|nr:glycosyltransferase [Acidimicrobiales bacterium]
MPAQVTAIIPTYNRRDLVVQSACSVLAQTCSEVACLVVDNGSSDGTAEALRALEDERLTVIGRDLPLGAAKARNVGIEAARTQWVAFLDNDDLWAPTKVELQLQALSKYSSARWCVAACAYVGADLTVQPGGRLTEGPLGPPDGQLLSSQELLVSLSQDNVIPGGGSSVLVDRELVLAAGGFHDDVPGCEDWDLWVRLARLSPLAYVDRPLAAWRMWEGQGSTDAGMMLRSANQVRAKYFPELGPVDDRYAQVWWASAARRHLSARRRVQASRHFAHLALMTSSPGQLAYALAALAAPSVAERRLQGIEPRPDPVWCALAGSWLTELASGG